MIKLLCRACGYNCGTVSKKLDKAIDAYVCPKCKVRTITKFVLDMDGEPADRLHMTTNQKLIEIMERDLPFFLGELEKKYSNEFLAKHFSALFLFFEGEPSDSFIPRFNGTTRAMFRAAHAAIRLIATELGKTTEGQRFSENERIAHVMNTLYRGISLDVGRQGVPDTIYNAFLQAHDEPPQ